MTRNFEGKIVTKERLTADAWEMAFDVSGSNFQFVAGQYVSITLPGLEDYPLPRQFHDFSITSPPGALPLLSIAFRESDSPYKSKLLSLAPGAVVRIDGPKGILRLPQLPENPLSFVAGGIGIAPFISMLRHATENRLSYQIDLFYQPGRSEQAAYTQELRRMEQENPRFTFHELSGQLGTDAIGVYASHNPGAQWYIAGPPGMVDSSRQKLVDCGILDTHIIMENFTGYSWIS